MDEDKSETKAGAANDETEILSERPQAETHGQAWSAAEDQDGEGPERHPWSAVTSQAAALITAGAAVATVVAVLGWIMLHRGQPTPAASQPSPTAGKTTVLTAPPPVTVTDTPPPPVAAPPLDGTYRLDLDGSRRTHNGQPDPDTTSNDSLWMGFRSACTSAGCVATGTALDPKNPQAANTRNYYFVLHWIDGRWEGEHSYQVECTVTDSDSDIKHQTELDTYSLQPQPDGTYRGTTTWAMQTNECYQHGSVREEPFVAARTGPPPPGIVADPPTMSIPSSPSSSKSASK